MSRHRDTLKPEYFQRLYEADPDPWRFATSGYERDKYAATMEALARPRYERALDVGCSIGVLTAQLSTRCGTLIAVEPIGIALAAARTRCAKAANVSFLQGMVPETWPDGRFDLIVLSEVLYYLSRDDLGELAAKANLSLQADAEMVLVHWTGETDYPLSGDAAADAFIEGVTAKGRFRPDRDRALRTGQYRLDVLTGR